MSLSSAVFAYREGSVLSACLFSEGKKPGLGCLAIRGCVSVSPLTSCLSLASFHASLSLSFHFPTVEMAVHAFLTGGWHEPWRTWRVRLGAWAPAAAPSMSGRFLCLDFPFAFFRKKSGEEILIWLVAIVFMRTCCGTQVQWGKSKKAFVLLLRFWKCGPRHQQDPGTC